MVGSRQRELGELRGDRPAGMSFIRLPGGWVTKPTVYERPAVSRTIADTAPLRRCASETPVKSNDAKKFVTTVGVFTVITVGCILSLEVQVVVGVRKPLYRAALAPHKGGVYVVLATALDAEQALDDDE